MHGDPVEHERISTVLPADRQIGTHVHCAGCGYNLRTLPYVGCCPECGAAYNARPLLMQNILTGQMALFPSSEVFAALLACSLAALLIGAGLLFGSEWAFLFGMIFGVFGVLFIRVASIHIGRCIKYRRILRQIEASEEE